MPRFSSDIRVFYESFTVKVEEFSDKVSSAGKSVFRFDVGLPGITPPKWSIKQLIKAIERGDISGFSYSPGSGLAELREAIASDLESLGGPRLSPEEVLVVSGGQHAMFVALATILEEGCEVITTDPTYFGYPSLVEYFKCRVRRVPTIPEKGFMIDVDALSESVVKNKTRAIIVVDPDNPTGRVLDRWQARAICEIASDADAWVLVDEAYATLVYEGSKEWLYSMSPERVVGLYTFSKDPGIPGWRLGYLYGSREFIREASLVSRETIYSPPLPAQLLVLGYLTDDRRIGFRESIRLAYISRRDVMVGELLKAGIEAYKPRGSIFVMADFSEYTLGGDSVSLAEDMLEKARVAVIPGSFFGQTTRKHLRLSFAVEDEARIVEGVKRIREFLGKAF